MIWIKFQFTDMHCFSYQLHYSGYLIVNIFGVGGVFENSNYIVVDSIVVH